MILGIEWVSYFVTSVPLSSAGITRLVIVQELIIRHGLAILFYFLYGIQNVSDKG
jgi:hypothetical protein